ncbi:MAG TPA: CsgG/HfaB family protein, partial [Gemmatimonadales bacterium]|nr:CsgG/HfaB family protein [Gemmatimonadales bacterium]
EPVGRGLTQLMITDLSKLRDLRLLERDRVQALVDEMSLTADGRVDPTTGARSGRMLRAARVVQGSLQDQPGGTDLRLDATVVDATNDKVVASGTATDPLRQLFDLQKNVLLRLVQQLGITLTPAERAALSERPTADLQAFLSFSRGLEDEDRGDYQAASADYQAALARDPNFKAARDRQQSTQRISQALQTPATVFAGVGPGGNIPDETQLAAAAATRGIVLRNGVLATVPSIGGVLSGRLGPVSRVPTARPELPEALGTDDAGTVGGLVGTIIIIITRP